MFREGERSMYKVADISYEDMIVLVDKFRPTPIRVRHFWHDSCEVEADRVRAIGVYDMGGVNNDSPAF